MTCNPIKSRGLKYVACPARSLMMQLAGGLKNGPVGMVGLAKKTREIAGAENARKI
jgi:hypothetical protein